MALSKQFISLNIILERNENYTYKYGLEAIFGIGNIINPFIIIGAGLSRRDDLIFNNNDYSPNYFFKLDYSDDNHIYCNLETLIINGKFEDNSYSYGFDFEIAAGWKSFIPIFIRYNISSKNNRGCTNNSNIYNFHEYRKSYLHLQYYGSTLSLSLGYSTVMESYETSYYSSEEHIYYAYYKYHGLGTTLDINFINKSLSIYGELHTLKNFNNDKLLSIAILGSRFYIN